MTTQEAPTTNIQSILLHHTGKHSRPPPHAFRPAGRPRAFAARRSHKLWEARDDCPHCIVSSVFSARITRDEHPSRSFNGWILPGLIDEFWTYCHAGQHTMEILRWHRIVIGLERGVKIIAGHLVIVGLVCYFNIRIMNHYHCYRIHDYGIIGTLKYPIMNVLYNNYRYPNTPPWGA